jgi:hypothetical protein
MRTSPPRPFSGEGDEKFGWENRICHRRRFGHRTGDRYRAGAGRGEDLIEAHDEGGHIVSTASIAGLIPGSGPAYDVTALAMRFD